MLKISQQGSDKILLVEFNLFSWKFLFHLIQTINNSLNLLTRHHTLIGFIMALGLGFGIGITIFSQPDISFAQTYEIKNNHQIISVSAKNFKTSVKKDINANLAQLDNQLIVPKFSGNFNNSEKAFILLGSNNLFSSLNSLSLGSKIKLNFSNQSYQTKTIIEIKTIKKEKILSLVPQTQPTTIFCAPKRILSAEYLCLITR